MLHEDAEDDDPAEDDGEDCCEAADDYIAGGVAPMYRGYRQLSELIGSEDDNEPARCGLFALDVANGTFAANDQ